MAHVWAARALLPAMRERGEGYLLNTASAAGLLTNLGLLPYSVTKHAAVGVAEWLAITYGDDGIRVSCLCPQLVDTPLAAAIKSEPRSSARWRRRARCSRPRRSRAIVVDGDRARGVPDPPPPRGPRLRDAARRGERALAARHAAPVGR